MPGSIECGNRVECFSLFRREFSRSHLTFFAAVATVGFHKCSPFSSPRYRL